MFQMSRNYVNLVLIFFLLFFKIIVSVQDQLDLKPFLCESTESFKESDTPRKLKFSAVSVLLKFLVLSTKFLCC